MRNILLILIFILSSCGGGGGSNGSSNQPNTKPEPIELILSLDENDFVIEKEDSFSLEIKSNLVIENFTINPTLPLGLSFNPITGIITGTAFEVKERLEYTIQKSNSDKIVSFYLEVLPRKISSLEYTIPEEILQGELLNVTPIFNGDDINFSSNNLPSGLNLEYSLGTISGNLNKGEYTFTITAYNTMSSVEKELTLTIKDIAPIIDYQPNNEYYINENINITALSSGGDIDSFTTLSPLPTGLVLNNLTGTISGSLYSEIENLLVRIKAINSTGEYIKDIYLNFINPNPRDLEYNASYAFDRFSNFSLSPLNSKGVNLIYSISPSLPIGLSFNSTTGEVSGSVSEELDSDYTITINNNYGVDSFIFNLAINEVAPTSIRYSVEELSKVSMIRGKSISEITVIENEGGDIDSYSISPTIFPGLDFNNISGTLSGNPSSLKAPTIFTITGSNEKGSVSYELLLEVIDEAPSNLILNNSSISVYEQASITPLTINSVTGIVDYYRIEPDLPQGLNLNSISGEISGTPTNIQSTKNYTLFAGNSAGESSSSLSIEILRAPPTNLTYSTSHLKIAQYSNLDSLFPDNGGGLVTSYNISPSLTNGLSFSTSTGRISGTPFSMDNNSYTITGTNSRGTASYNLIIEVTSPLVIPTTNFNNGNMIVGDELDLKTIVLKQNYDAINSTWSIIESPQVSSLYSNNLNTRFSPFNVGNYKIKIEYADNSTEEIELIVNGITNSKFDAPVIKLDKEEFILSNINDSISISAATSITTNNTFIFDWQLIKKPLLSNLSLSNQNNNIVFQPDVAGLFVIKLSLSDGNQSSSRIINIHSYSQENPINVNPEIIKLTKDNSPYALTEDLIISNKSLMIEEGVLVIGNNHNLILHNSKLIAIANQEERIIIKDVNLSTYRSPDISPIYISHVTFSGGNFCFNDFFLYGDCSGTIVAKKSTFSNLTQNINLGYQGNNSVKIFKENLFYSTSPFDIGDYSGQNIIIEENTFISPNNTNSFQGSILTLFGGNLSFKNNTMYNLPNNILIKNSTFDPINVSNNFWANGFDINLFEDLNDNSTFILDPSLSMDYYLSPEWR